MVGQNLLTLLAIIVERFTHRYGEWHFPNSRALTLTANQQQRINVSKPLANAFISRVNKKKFFHHHQQQ